MVAFPQAVAKYYDVNLIIITELSIHCRVWFDAFKKPSVNWIYASRTFLVADCESAFNIS